FDSVCPAAPNATLRKSLKNQPKVILLIPPRNTNARLAFHSRFGPTPIASAAAQHPHNPLTRANKKGATHLSHLYPLSSILCPLFFIHPLDRKSTRLNSSHRTISYAVFCLKKKNNIIYKLKHI